MVVAAAAADGLVAAAGFDPVDRPAVVAAMPAGVPGTLAEQPQWEFQCWAQPSALLQKPTRWQEQLCYP